MIVELQNALLSASGPDAQAGVMVPALDLSSVTVIIPALNEALSLPFVLRDLPKVGRVIVVDNGSIDGTGEVARRCGAEIVREPTLGYGAACLAGLKAIHRSVVAGRVPPRIVAFLDADYSDHPEFLPHLIRPILDGKADFVLGSRLRGRREPGSMPPQSLFGNRLACLLMWALLGTVYTDLGPFRAIDYAALCRLHMADRNFGWTVEMQIKAARAQLRILEVPVPYRRRIGTSKISGTLAGTIKAGSKIIYTIAKHGWKSWWINCSKASAATAQMRDPRFETESPTRNSAFAWFGERGSLSDHRLVESVVHLRRGL